MKSPAARNIFRAAVGSILVGIASQATLSFAAVDPSTENVPFARAGGPRVEHRVAAPARPSEQAMVRMVRYVRA